MMIKKLFLPEEINNYYLFPKRILGVDIGKTHVHITQILISGTATTVEKTVSENIEPGAATAYGERAAAALQKAIAQCEAYNEIRTALSSAQIVFKELSLPFTTRGKIEKIIGFEVEPLLPFTLADAAIDFVITAVNQEHQSAHVLVAAVQKQYIAQHLHIFEQAGIRPNIITVDLLAVYGLYTSAPKFARQEGFIALVDIGFNSTRIACIYNKQLRTIRTINKGISHLAKAVSDSMGITPAQALENIIRFGLRETDNPTYHKAIHDALSQLTNDMSFTFNSFSYQMKHPKSVDTVYLLGGGAQMRGIMEFISTTLGLPCESFDSELLGDLPGVTFKNKLMISNDTILSLSVALPSPTTKDFNLLSEELSQEQQTLFNKQIIVTGILSLLFIGLLTTYTFMQTSKFSWAVDAAEREAVAALKEQLPDIASNKLDVATDDAQEEVAKEEKTWFAFSNRVRSSYLKYLLELHNRIDKQTIGLTVDRITIAENTVTLKGHVADFDAFRALRKTVRESDLFGQPEAKEELDFTMTIPLINAEEE